MTENPVKDESVPLPSGSTPATENIPVCPITPEFLAPNMRKHVEASAPAALRMMAAKAMVPLAPGDMLGALFMLLFDPDPSVRETATKTCNTLTDRILSAALRDENVPPPVLAHFLGLLWETETYAELLVLNDATPDQAVAEMANKCGARTAEVLSQNQLRLLRYDDVIRQLCRNPRASKSMIDGVCDFAVRSGVVLADVPQIKEARIRLYGPEAAESPPDPGPTAEEVMAEYTELTSENAPPMEEGKRLTLTQRIMKMNVAEKIKMATKGNKEARTLLIRDSNKLVACAVIRSPRITDGEVLSCANNRTINDDVLRIIYGNREWTKKYPVRLALTKNPKTPLGISMKFLSTLRESEIKDLARNKNVPSSIQLQSKKMIDKKNTPKKDDGH